MPVAHRALAIPGLGLCLPERIGDGWLVRPTELDHTITARLDLTGSPGNPVLEVRSDHEPWRTALTPRHADLLARLGDVGRVGLTAEQLSVAIYGDPAHAVTVRAEMSRLRRVVGALVSTNPYRLADGVQLMVLRPPAQV